VVNDVVRENARPPNVKPPKENSNHLELPQDFWTTTSRRSTFVHEYAVVSSNVGITIVKIFVIVDHVELAKKLSSTTYPAVVVGLFFRHRSHVEHEPRHVAFHVPERRTVVTLRLHITATRRRKNARNVRFLLRKNAYAARRP